MTTSTATKDRQGDRAVEGCQQPAEPPGGLAQECEPRPYSRGRTRVDEKVDDQTGHAGAAIQGEDQGHVDAAAFGDHGLDGGHAGGRGRDLDQQVGLSDASVQVSGGRTVARVSSASSGATSIETNPSAPSVASKVGRKL